MSRIGKQPIAIPAETEVTLDGGFVTVKGPLGELSRLFKPDVAIKKRDNEVVLAPVRESIASRALWGTYASHIKNMIRGVNAQFTKRLVIEGVGYRASVSGDTLVLSIGFSHLVEIAVPEGISIAAQKNVISISGIDKEQVGRFAAEVRSKRKPEPYKGKGIRYENEVVRRKQGKKAA